MAGIANPVTYGDFYWKAQVEAQQEFEEQLEINVKPWIPNIFNDPGIRDAMPFDILDKLEGLLAFPTQGLASIGGRFVSEVADQAVSMVMGPALRKTQYAANRLFTNMILSPDQATALYRRKRLSSDAFDEVLQNHGFASWIQPLVYQASQPYPTLPEVFRWGRHHAEGGSLWSAMVDYIDLDPVDFPVWEWLTQPQFTTEQILNRHRRSGGDEDAPLVALSQLGWSTDKHQELIDLSYVIPNAMILLQGDLMQEVTHEQQMIDLGVADIHPDYRDKYMDAVLTKPASMDLVNYHLRQENNLSGLRSDLTKIGIHSDYLDVYETLAWQIPPIPDLVTMAVREAFSPAIAARFGQYEDFPPDFAKFAAQKGLSEEWAKRYWAAHWNLPSPQQGFAMLHRGIIDKADLEMLLRAQDVMPFWRDKLIQIAYRPLTRVDVRRMYKEGVLDTTDVYDAYLDQGYNPKNARRMTEFTIKQTLSSLAKFTSTDIVGAYAKGVIAESEARSLLIDIGIAGPDASTIISYARNKRQWDFTQDRIRAIGNLYRKHQLDDSQARGQLGLLNLPSGQTQVLMDTWFAEDKEKPKPTWTKADVLKFIEAGIITKERGIIEFQRIGYDKEHIDAYVEGLA